MGCSTSKLEEEEVTQICKDRKNFVKEAIKQRIRFASSHISYIQSLREVSAALCNFIEGDKHHHELLLDDCLTTPSIPVIKYSMYPDAIRIPLKYTPSPPSEYKHYLLSEISPVVSVEESHQPLVSETIRIVSYNNPSNNLGYDEVEVPGKMEVNSTIEVDSDDLASDVNIGTNGKQMWKYHTHGVVGLYARTGQEMVESTQSKDAGEENPTFKVSFNMTLTSISEAMREIENQFKKICDCAEEISEILETTRYRYYSSSSNELTGIKMLNPANWIQSASSLLHTTSSRTLQTSTCSTDKNGESSRSDNSEETNFLASSHHSTLDRLYAWEKKLYKEVKYEERIRIAYEKKCGELKNHDVTGKEYSVVSKTSRSIRNLGTKLRISIRSIEVISMRIEKLRDEELHPQLMGLMQGLMRLWRAMADSHWIQKHAIQEASSFLSTSSPSPSSPRHPSRSASILSSALRNWTYCLQTWITSQRSYANALGGWVQRCSTPPGSDETPSSPSLLAPIVEMCNEWSRIMESVSESVVIGGLELVAEGVGMIHEEEEEEDERRTRKANGVRIVCDGMNVSFGRLAEFAARVAEPDRDWTKNK